MGMIFQCCCDYRVNFFNMQSQTAGSGLQNLGNTCFFNATLQSLLHSPPLRKILQNKNHSSTCTRKNQWCVFCEMERVHKGTHNARIFSPNNMVNNLKKIFKKFKLGRQQDAHEFLRYLVEGMQDHETGKLPKEQRDDNEKKIRLTQSFGVFGGVMKTIVECLGCSHKSITPERYYDFNIECQRASSLHEGLTNFFSVDKLEGSNKYFCDHCKNRSNARKRYVLDTVPQVATFQLKRFTNSMRKIGKFVQYPLQLDLGKYLEKPRKIAMRLFAIVVHLGGSSFSGHYYAFVRVGNTWYKMDDSYVSKCSPESVMNQQAYLLFYEREEPFEKEESKIDAIEITTIAKQKEQKQISSSTVASNAKNNNKDTKSQKDDKRSGVNGINHKENVAEQPSQPLLEEIQHRLVQKLTHSEAFQHLPNKDKTLNQTVSQAVKQVLMEVSPQKLQAPLSPRSNIDDLELPGLSRTKSKEQMEREMPMADLIIRTFEKIMDIRTKMPARRPRNYSKRCMYDLRNYETKMQKKRKLG